MTLAIIAAMGVATAAAGLITMSRAIGFKRIKKHATVVDVSLTLVVAALLAGTVTGTLVAILAGLTVAVFLSGARLLDRLYETLRAAISSLTGRKSSAVSDEFDADGVWVYNKAPYV